MAKWEREIDCSQFMHLAKNREITPTEFYRKLAAAIKVAFQNDEEHHTFGWEQDEYDVFFIDTALHEIYSELSEEIPESWEEVDVWLERLFDFGDWNRVAINTRKISG